MKVIINYTVFGFDASDSIFDNISYMTVRHKSFMEELGYELLKFTVGVHRNAERMHLHFHTVNEIGDKKMYKTLPAKIKRLKAYSDHDLPHPKFMIPKIKITVKYEEEDGYDTRKSLAYPLKEYDTNECMFKDIDFDDVFGITLEELYDLRAYANSLYKEYVLKYNERQKQQEDKKDKKMALYDHLDKVIVTTNIPDYNGEVCTIVRYTVKQMLIYYKMNNQNFSIHQLKNVAINYLYFKEIIDERQICVYAQI